MKDQEDEEKESSEDTAIGGNSFHWLSLLAYTLTLRFLQIPRSADRELCLSWMSPSFRLRTVLPLQLVGFKPLSNSRSAKVTRHTVLAETNPSQFTHDAPWSSPEINQRFQYNSRRDISFNRIKSAPYEETKAYRIYLAYGRAFIDAKPFIGESTLGNTRGNKPEFPPSTQKGQIRTTAQ